MSELFVRQQFDPLTSTYTYLLADKASGEAILIDPVLEMVPRDLEILRGLGLRLLFTLETHLHADHITGAAKLKKLTGSQIAIGKDSGAKNADRYLRQGDRVQFGTQQIEVLATPGHTPGCLSFYIAPYVFTGDALLIGLTGRTDFQNGSAQQLYQSIKSILFTLPKTTVVYPGHDYRGLTRSSIDEELRLNARIGGGRSEKEFIETMNSLQLAPPKNIAVAVPANIVCGEGY